MTAVKPGLDARLAHVPYLLEVAKRRCNAELDDLADTAAFPDLRGSHVRLLCILPDDGARPSALADAALVTRQALGQMLAHLAEGGYVESVPDAADRRAVIVRRTRRGDAAAAAGMAGIAALEGTWAREVGAERFAAFRDVLRELVLGGPPLPGADVQDAGGGARP